MHSILFDIVVGIFYIRYNTFLAFYIQTPPRTTLHLLSPQRFRQQRNLFIKQLLSIRPNPCRGPILELQQRLLEPLAKRLGGLARQHGWQVVDADDGEGLGVAIMVALDLDGHGGVLEGGVDGVDGDGVVRVRRVAGYVDDDSEVAAGLGEEVVVDEGWDGVGEVDLVRFGVSRLSGAFWKRKGPGVWDLRR